MKSSDQAKEIKRIAKCVRIAMEELAAYEEHENKIGGNDYVYLAGYCGRASAMLSIALQNANIAHQIVGACGHVFVKWNGYIVDVTATQFKHTLGKSIMRRPHSLLRSVGIHKFLYWKAVEYFNNADELWSWQKKNHWPDEQVSREYDMKFLYSLKEYKDMCHGI